MTHVDPPEGLVLDPRQTDVVVVVVTYNSSRVVGRLLAALPAALRSVPRCRVVVVDNDSGDGTPDLVRRTAPWIDVMQTGRNAGYAGAINLALAGPRPARATYVLNPDAVPSPGSVRRMLDVVERDRSVGIAVPRMLSPDGRPCASLRREPSIPRAMGEALLGGGRAARFALLGETVGEPARYRDGAVADWATGAALLISRAASDAAREWDERFFLYSEETDYCLRVRDAGLRVQLVDGAHVVHQGGEQSTSPALWALAAVNRTRLYRKRHALPASVVFWMLVLVNESIRAAGGRGQRHRVAVRALLVAGPDQGSGRPTPQVLGTAGPLRGHAAASGSPGVRT